MLIDPNGASINIIEPLENRQESTFAFSTTPYQSYHFPLIDMSVYLLQHLDFWSSRILEAYSLESKIETSLSRYILAFIILLSRNTWLIVYISEEFLSHSQCSDQ